MSHYYVSNIMHCVFSTKERSKLNMMIGLCRAKLSRPYGTNLSSKFNF